MARATQNLKLKRAQLGRAEAELYAKEPEKTWWKQDRDGDILTLRREIQELIEERRQLVNICDEQSERYMVACMNQYIYAVSPLFLELAEISSYDYHAAKDVATFFLARGKNFTYYQPVTTNYFGLGKRFLANLNVCIRHANGDDLKGCSNEPTIVKIPTDQDYEYRNCFIDSGQDDPTNFYASLPGFLSQFGVLSQWEMALTKACIPHSFRHFTREIKFKIVE